eukprot:COSAG06_NODE_7005_length_2663_cov_8.500581_3_plen_370_part_00
MTPSGHLCWKLGHRHLISPTNSSKAARDDDEQPVSEPEPELEPQPQAPVDTASAAAEPTGFGLDTASEDMLVRGSSKPDELAEHLEAVRQMADGGDGGAYNGGYPTPTWWQAEKVNVMYRCNLAKYQQHEEFREVLLGGRGPITAYGAPFWAKWNAIILERIREELRPEGSRDEQVIADSVRWMQEYNKAASVGDDFAIEVRASKSLLLLLLPLRLPLRLCASCETADRSCKAGADSLKNCWCPPNRGRCAQEIGREEFVAKIHTRAFVDHRVACADLLGLGNDTQFLTHMRTHEARTKPPAAKRSWGAAKSHKPLPLPVPRKQQELGQPPAGVAPAPSSSQVASLFEQYRDKTGDNDGSDDDDSEWES